MDLRVHYPRSVREKLAGYVHLARMIDKCRAVLTGTQGEYIYPCPMDRRLLEFAGLEADQFTQTVQARSSDQAVADWFAENAAQRSQAEIEAWNEMMLTRGPDTEEKWQYFKSILEAVDSSRTDIISWTDLLDLEEKRSVPKRQTTISTGR
ncbi:MAG: DUF5069 domain-containing protein [Nitrospirae bacterium]|nr:MAG: DUF5069 domain-containing protein [Nitrospirota bacterium]